MTTPLELGLLTLDAADGGDAFLRGIHPASGVPFAISADAGVDQAWVAATMADIGRHEATASAYLVDQLAGGEFADPEVIFWTGTHWSILFATGSLPICDPFGILVDLDRDTAVGFQDLSADDDD